MEFQIVWSLQHVTFNVDINISTPLWDSYAREAEVAQLSPLQFRKFYLMYNDINFQFFIHGVQSDKYNIKLLYGQSEYLKLFK
jgi:hypothetical protein